MTVTTTHSRTFAVRTVGTVGYSLLIQTPALWQPLQWRITNWIQSCDVVVD